MKRLLFFSIIIGSGVAIFLNFSFSQSIETSESFCVYSLAGFLVAANSDLCPSYGTPTVISDAYGHASLDNGLLLYDEKLYFTMLVGGGFGGRDLPNEMTATNEWKAEICPYHYDQNGNFFAGWANRHYSLSDAQQKVLLDMQANYSVFICPFTGTPTPSSPPVSGFKGSITSGTVNVMDLGKNNSQSNVTNSVSNITSSRLIPNFYERSLSPLKQFESGIAITDVKCNKGFQLVIRNENGHPACVTQEIASKLIDRGWGVILLHGLPTSH